MISNPAWCGQEGGAHRTETDRIDLSLMALKIEFHIQRISLPQDHLLSWLQRGLYELGQVVHLSTWYAGEWSRFIENLACKGRGKNMIRDWAKKNVVYILEIGREFWHKESEKKHKKGGPNNLSGRTFYGLYILSIQMEENWIGRW